MNPMRRSSDREQELKRQGWTRQFVAREPRLSETVELYQATGYEVHLEPLAREGETDLEGGDRCTACFDGFEEQYRIIYTRPRRDRVRGDDDLW